MAIDRGNQPSLPQPLELGQIAISQDRLLAGQTKDGDDLALCDACVLNCAALRKGIEHALLAF